MLRAGPGSRFRAELQASRCDEGLETLSRGHRHASVSEEVRVPADLWRLPAFSRHHHITGSLISSLSPLSSVAPLKIAVLVLQRQFQM